MFEKTKNLTKKGHMSKISSQNKHLTERKRYQTWKSGGPQVHMVSIYDGRNPGEVVGMKPWR
jgi:hypothetical protein